MNVDLFLIRRILAHTVVILIVVFILVYIFTESHSEQNKNVIVSHEVEKSEDIEAAYKACNAQHLTNSEKGTCFRQLATDLFQDYSIQQIERSLDTLPGSQKNIWCHELMHYLGWEIYRHTQDIAESFVKSSGLCDSGMYHGVMEKYISSKGFGISQTEQIEKITFVCQESLAHHPQFSDGLLRLCFHGLGHGVMFLTDYDLKESLAMCDYLRPDGVQSCYSGVFMEAISFKQNDPHSIQTINSDRSIFDLSDYCPELSGEQREICYRYIGSNFLSETGGDVKEAMNRCIESVPESEKEVCFAGVGINVPGPHQSHSEASQACVAALEVSERAYYLCVQNALSFVAALDRGASGGVIEFCGEVPDRHEEFCYKEAYLQINQWHIDNKSVDDFCKSLVGSSRHQSCVMSIEKS